MKEIGTTLPTMKGPGLDRVEDSVRLYVGSVMHARLKPFIHRFQYTVFNLLLDVDRLEDAGQISPLFNVNKPGLVSFRESDHGDGRMRGLADHIRDLLRDDGFCDAPEQILLLCYPRIFGFVFNPISIYYCKRGNKLIAMVYEVRNTFGGEHIYVQPVREGEWNAAGLRQECDKAFHVSPFIDMPMRYFFRLTAPLKTVSFRILEKDAEGPLLSATLHAEQRPFNSLSLSKLLIGKPFFTLKVLLAIHFEALKLWIKGAKFHRHPDKNRIQNG